MHTWNAFQQYTHNTKKNDKFVQKHVMLVIWMLLNLFKNDIINGYIRKQQ